MGEVGQWHGVTRREGGDDREWRGGGGVDRGERPIDAADVGLAVNDDELAVQAGEGTQAQIAMVQQLADGEFAVVPGVHERRDGGRLEQVMRRGEVVAGAPAVLGDQMQRPYEVGVHRHARSVPARGAGCRYAPYNPECD